MNDWARDFPEVLDSGSMYEIRGSNLAAVCQVLVPGRVKPEDGAAAALRMCAFLCDRICTPSSNRNGLIVDVRLGPTVFGPVTRAALESMFEAAQKSKTVVVALVGSAAMQRLQFAALCREHAPTLATVLDSHLAALHRVHPA